MLKGMQVKLVWWGLLLIIWIGSIAASYFVIAASGAVIGIYGFISAIPPIVFWPVYLIAGLIRWKAVRLPIRALLVASLVLDDYWGSSAFFP